MSLHDKFTVTAWAFLWLFLSLAFVWLLGFAELSYLGTKGIKFLYNCFARIYDWKWAQDKYSSPALTQKLFLQDLQTVLQGPEARLLDLACGTGRISLMVLQQEWFQGRIEAIDFSEGMLSQLKSKLGNMPHERSKRLEVSCRNLVEWKAAKHESYAAVTLLEAGEFLPNFVELTKEIYTSLQPGGLFICTKPPDWMAWVYFGRKQSTAQLTELLSEVGFVKIEILSWTSRYQVLKAWKGKP